MSSAEEVAQREPAHIVSALLDSLLGRLRLAFVIVRWNDPRDGRSIEMERAAASSPRSTPADYSLASAQLGLRGQIGILVAGSERVDFPTETDRLVLDVAVSQATIALQQAQLVAERNRTQEALRESDRRSRVLVDSIPGLVALLSASGGLEVANRQILEYTGRTLEELRQWGTSILLTDVDEAKRAADAIRESEQNLKLIIDTIPALAWSARPDGSIDFFNKHYLDFIGLSPEQARGWDWTAAVHPDDASGLAATWQRIMASAAPGEAEARLRRQDGAYRWFLFRANPLRDANGTVVKWYGVNTDIQDRKRAEEALRRSETFLLEVQRLSHTGGWRYDVVTDIVESSAEIQRFYDIQPGEDISRPPFWFDRIHPEDRPRVEAEFARCMRDKTDYQAGYRIVLPNGTVRYQHATGHPIVNAANELVEFVGALKDMTEHWRATKELERASDTLRELQASMSRAAQVAAVGEFAASIAHEVNQPLSGIITNANTCLRMLATNPPNVEGARETARRTLRDGNRAADVITRLRALFSKHEFTLDSMDLNEAIREVIALSSNDLQRNRIILQTELADDLPNVIGDRVQLQQVLLNLLRNASDAMAGVVDRPRQLVIRTQREDGDRVRVIVRDSGVGFDRESIDRLFDAFYTTKSDGMGIGLSVSRSIVERHHGRLWAESNDGPGATFAFSIPRVH